ncbi:MAG: hypothetical protein ACJAS1_005718 [Oleiphilaceae bacterium]|jgi:hypothetical protein
MATLNEYTVLDPSIEPAWGTNKCHMRPIPLVDISELRICAILKFSDNFFYAKSAIIYKPVAKFTMPLHYDISEFLAINACMLALGFST